MVEEQFNGGEFAPLTPEDWELILPYLQENERLFGISIEDHLLMVDGGPQKTGGGLSEGKGYKAGRAGRGEHGVIGE